jgi:hypothetical protein
MPNCFIGKSVHTPVALSKWSPGNFPRPYLHRLVYVRDGKRMVGYDNERGKGDHKHLGERELRYRFVNEAKLLADFWQDVMEATNEKP